MPLVIKPTGIQECSLRTVETLAKKFDIDENGCWVWNGYCNKFGYGQFTVKGKSRTAHRVMWELTGNPVDLSLQLDHLCRVKRCINPKHLEQVTAKVNTLRGNSLSAINARMTHCAKGHPLSGENLYIVKYKHRPSIRRCLTCMRVYTAAWWRNRRKELSEQRRLKAAIDAQLNKEETDGDSK